MAEKRARFPTATGIVFAFVVERLVLRPLVNQEGIILFMATIGVSYFLDGFAQTVWGSDVYKLDVGLPNEPVIILESVFDGGILVNQFDLVAAVIAGVLVTVLAIFFQKTRIGRALRAVADDHQANRGLNAHIEDVARRAAKAGFLAIAPNALSSLGGTPENADEARAKFQQLKPEDNLQNFIKVFDYLSARKDSNGKFGFVGFCWGGAMSNNLAVHVPSLKAAVAFYGRQPGADDVSKIKAAVQLHYGSLDEGVNKGIPAYEEALKKNNVAYELYIYEGAQHALHYDTAPTRYNEAAAKLAWQRTVDFFNKYLK